MACAQGRGDRQERMPALALMSLETWRHLLGFPVTYISMLKLSELAVLVDAGSGSLRNNLGSSWQSVERS